MPRYSKSLEDVDMALALLQEDIADAKVSRTIREARRDIALIDKHFRELVKALRKIIR